MNQYLNTLKEEHNNKLTVLKEMEDRYREKITQQNRNIHYQDELEAIEKRGVLEK